MIARMDGTALVFCEGAFGTSEGKAANGLVRFGRRYDILGVVDSNHSGHDAGEIIAGVARRTPIFASLHQAVEGLGRRPDYLVIGLSPADGRMPAAFRRVVRDALRMGVSVDSPLRPYLQEDAEFPGLAQQSSARIRSVGYPKPFGLLRSYTGEIERVRAPKVAVVGTDALVGKRTTTVRLAETLGARGYRTEMIGTGETSWLQGVRSTVILDSVVSRFVAGELEGAILDANDAYQPQIFVLEGQGSVCNPANPSGVELLTTANPDAIVMQHAPARATPAAADRFGIDQLYLHLRVSELLASSPVVAIAVNPEGCAPDEFAAAKDAIHERFGLLVTDVIADGPDALADAVVGSLRLAPG
jgi:uncharacterized NAD-dependent epimerase/dehydratase family protein